MKAEPILATDIKGYFQELGQEGLTDKDLLTEFILKRIGCSFRRRDFDIAKDEALQKNFGLKQWPDELASFLLFLYEHKESINSYLEFGTGCESGL
jgi:hypothetical protein